MDWIYRELSGFVIPKTNSVTDDDITLINGLPNPPLVPVTANDVYIRKCKLAGDGIDAGFGRFRTEDLSKILSLTAGAPALIGHRKDSLGVARFFGGEITIDEENGTSYVVPKFYWMKAHSQAEDLRINLDGGIYSEASLGFTFRKPTCSACGNDIRTCEHIPGRLYSEQLCHFWYDDIVRVTEGSFVYRGAQPGTGFNLNLKVPQPHLQEYKALPRFRWNGEWYIGIKETQINQYRKTNS